MVKYENSSDVSSNLNLLGIRQKDVYGNDSYAQLKMQISNFANENKIDTQIFSI